MFVRVGAVAFRGRQAPAEEITTQKCPPLPQRWFSRRRTLPSYRLTVPRARCRQLMTGWRPLRTRRSQRTDLDLARMHGFPL